MFSLQECKGSICQRIGWKQCFLKAPRIDKGYDKGKLCYVACQSEYIMLCLSVLLKRGVPNFGDLRTVHLLELFYICVKIHIAA